MLHSFTFQNFCSFRREARVDLSGPSKGGPRYLRIGDDDWVNRVLAVVGPNASGKTTILKALAFCNWFMFHSFHAMDDSEEKPIPFHPFADPEQQGEEPAEFSVRFSGNGGAYEYSFKLTNRAVLFEQLRYLEGRKSRNIFTREGQQARYTNIAERSKASAFGSILKPRHSLLSLLIKGEVDEALQAQKSWGSFISNVNIAGRIHEEEITRMAHIVQHTSRAKESERLRQFVFDHLRNLDLGVDHINIEHITVEDKGGDKPDDVYFPVMHHRIRPHGKLKTFDLPIWLESSGTQSLFLQLARIADVLANGAIAAIDEFESDLHPDLIWPILQLFFNQETNPKGAQLLFSCHSTQVLKRLHKEQILLVEKDEFCESQCWRLSDIEGVRRDENYYSKYHAGAYGAVPQV